MDAEKVDEGAHISLGLFYRGRPFRHPPARRAGPTGDLRRHDLVGRQVDRPAETDDAARAEHFDPRRRGRLQLVTLDTAYASVRVTADVASKRRLAISHPGATTEPDDAVAAGEGAQGVGLNAHGVSSRGDAGVASRGSGVTRRATLRAWTRSGLTQRQRRAVSAEPTTPGEGTQVAQ